MIFIVGKIRSKMEADQKLMLRSLMIRVNLNYHIIPS